MHYIPAAQPLPPDALLLDNTVDVLTQGAAVQGRQLIVLNFPKWTDGRAYSQAVLLRSRLGYAGELLAAGEVLVDMLPLLQRCGFSAVQLRADQTQGSAERALGYFAGHYQSVPAGRGAAAGGSA
jgi:uncharacterized protein (DUF934 family)